MRFFFEISYNGTNYHGWQSQANAVGVQQVVEDVFEKLFRNKIEIVGSGRTDTGVHCVKQFFHADFENELDYPMIQQKLNSFLPKAISINDIKKVKPDAHARYNAIERGYEYRITRVKNPFYQDYAFHFFKEINIQTMNEAAALLVGEHDFQCFSKVKTDVNHFICNLKKARWDQKKNLLVFNIVANRFLRGMVRSIVGTLLDVGTGKTSLKTFQHIIKNRDRRKAGMNVPACGLYLVDVKYPKGIFLD